MKRFYILVSCILLVSAYGFAQQIPFQGRLLDNDRPFNGTATIDFSITSPVWSETKADVPVVDGYYSVVLGSTTPLPDTLFGDSREVLLNITVNGEVLGPVTLHSPLLPFTGTLPVEIDSIVTNSVHVLGVNDDTRVNIFADNNGYDGAIVLTDSLNRTGAFITTDRATGTGGYIQLNGRDNVSGSLNSAVVAGTILGGRQNSFMDLYGENSAGTGPELLVDLYASDTDETGTLTPTGYRRGGLDIKNYYGLPTHNIFSFEDASSNVTSAINLSASPGAASPVSTVFLSSGDGVGSGGMLELSDETGNITASMTAFDGGGLNLNGRVNLTGNLNSTGSGGVEVANPGGSNTIILDGEFGNITANGDVSGNTLTSSDGMVQTSDRRLKKNINDLNSPLANTLKMRGVSYQWKDEEKSQRNQIGVIAQEVEEIYPEFVFTNENGMKAVNYAQMTAVLIEAIKELNRKVESLEKENTDLKASLNEVKVLRSQVDDLMKMLGGGKAASK